MLRSQSIDRLQVHVFRHVLPGDVSQDFAAEIGYDEQEAKEIGLFHDIGHAVEEGVEGSHAIIGGEILARLGRPATVVQAVRAHHYDEEPRSIGAFIVMTADAIAARKTGTSTP